MIENLNLFNLYPDGILTCDLKGNILQCNQAVVNGLGFSSTKDLAGKTIFELVAKKDYKKVKELMNQVLNRGWVKDVEYQLLTHNGAEIFIEFSACIIKDYLEKPSGFAVIAKDVRARKKAEKQLQASEKRFREVLDHMMEGCQIIGHDWRYLYINDAFTKQAHIAEENLIGKTLMDIYPGIEKNNFFFHLKRCMMETCPVRVENEFTFPESEKGWFEFFIAPVPEGVFVLSLDITERKKIEHALYDSEEKHRKLFEESMDAIFIADTKTGKIIDCNPVALSLVGYERSELIGQPQEFIHPKESIIAGFTVGFKQHLENQAHVYETKVLTKKGELKDVAIKANLFELKGKKMIQGTFRDITEHKKIEELLKKVKDFDDAIIDSLESLLIIDPCDHKILYSNKIAMEQLKLARENIVGKTCYQISHHRQTPCKAPEHVCPIPEALKTGKPVTVEHIHQDNRNGELFVEISAYPMTNPQGKSVIIHVSKNITQQRLMEQVLQENEEKFRTISNSLKDALILIDNNGKIVFWNPSAEQIFGYEQEEVLGKDAHQLLARNAERKRIIELGIKKFAETGKGDFIGQTMELTTIRKNGVKFPISLSLSAMFLRGKWFAVALVRDITELLDNRKKLQRYAEEQEKLVLAKTWELTETQDQLLKAERLATIGELAGMVGHDLRNPLAGISNAAYYLGKKGNVCSEDAKAMLDIINNSVKHANKIINDLLNYAADFNLELRECSLRSLLVEALSMVKVPTNIRILDYTFDSPKIFVDKDKMVRVWVNLIKNAIDAMPTGGTLEIRSTQNKEYLEITFHDIGKGIPKEVITKIFTPLVTTKAQGMGFGLPICKRIVETHGGTIGVESFLDKGTTFTIKLLTQTKKEETN